MKDTLATLAFGGMIAILGLMFLIDVSPTSHKNVLENAIKECEKSLPRDQYCTIIAVPVSKD